jgi:hypothetical protein
MKVVRLSALLTSLLYSPTNIPVTHFCYWPSQPQGHDTIGNQTRDLPACGTVPQQTVPPHASPKKAAPYNKIKKIPQHLPYLMNLITAAAAQ